MLKNKLMDIAFQSEEITLAGEKFLVKEMNGKDAGRYENSLYTVVGDKVKPNTENAKCKLVLYTLYDIEGKRVFEDKDISQIQELPASIVDKIFDVANKLNGLNEGQSEKN